MQSPRAGSIEEKVAHLDELLADVDEVDVHDFQQRFDMSWIYHDSALEGVVHSFPELNAALDAKIVSDSSLLPAYDEIRQHKAAIDLVRELADKKRAAIDLEPARLAWTGGGLGGLGARALGQRRLRPGQAFDGARRR